MTDVMKQRMWDIAYQREHVADTQFSGGDLLSSIQDLAKKYSTTKGDEDLDKYNDECDNYLRAMVRMADEVARYHYQAVRRELDIDARHYKYPTARILFFLEMAIACENYTNLQETLDHRGLKRLLSGNYDDYLKEDRIPLPFEWLNEHR